MQTILGAGGVIGRELSHFLPAWTARIRQAARNPRKVHATDEIAVCDLLDPRATDRAVEGSEVAYLVAGLEYASAVWEVEWPRVMGNVIEACSRHGTGLVFFDNVYAYGRVQGPMTEDTPFNPCSRKGEVRAKIALTLLDAISTGAVRGMVVRSADFYGPGADSSFTGAVVIDRIRSGQSPRWLGNEKAYHTLTFTIDAARCMAQLGNSEEAWGQTWHALSAPEPLTGGGFVRMACEVARQPYDLKVPPRWLLSILSRFDPVLAENQEMMYQFEHDYLFDSTKVREAFGLEATPYRHGLRATLHTMDERDLRARLRAGRAG